MDFLGEHQGEGVRRDAADGGVGAEVVDQEARFGERTESVLVEAVVAEGAVEGFDEGILQWFAGLDVVEGDAGSLSPEMEIATGKLGAVVGGDDGGQTARAGELIEDGNDGGPADEGIYVESQALAREVIDEGEATEAASAGELVMDEDHAPALVRSRGSRSISSRPRRAPKKNAIAVAAGKMGGAPFP